MPPRGMPPGSPRWVTAEGSASGRTTFSGLSFFNIFLAKPGVQAAVGKEGSIDSFSWKPTFNLNLNLNILGFRTTESRGWLPDSF